MFSLNTYTEVGAEGERRAGPERLALTQEIVTLDQKVSQLFEHLREPVYRYLTAVFGNPAEAEEVTQEAFLRLYSALQGGQRIENVRAWVFRVAHNLAINQWKSQKRQNPAEFVSWEELTQVRQDPGPNPEERVLQQEKSRQLQDALAQLSLQQRQCLLLRAEGLRYREIGEILGISTSTVVEFLRRGITNIIGKTHG
ncbi:MAG: RNA polymerase sigma factor [Acidobacteria bacterium]|nr:RNA polymerase sigma factor [Acidobacteriota bacterium]MCI0626959.1 RNA polymerase sigma factor [Acidobacteriota bacterium]MCI0724596.1 RNA polymerase sigma factor [Acidobacteriota bacterium]